jgi:hypothetical protein
MHVCMAKLVTAPGSNPPDIIPPGSLEAFVPVYELTGSSRAKVDIQTLRDCEIDVQYLRGQGYDGASNMSCSIKGIQACIAHDYPLASYVHCVSHALNLVLS